MAARAQAALDRLRDEGDYGPLTWLSVAVGPRGSYRQEHVLKHLERHLPLLTPRDLGESSCATYTVLTRMTPLWRQPLAEATCWHSTAVVAQASCNATTRACTNA